MSQIEFKSEEIINRIARKDKKAFRLFYNHFYPSVYRYTSYFLSAKEDCEEVVSDVFFIIWRRGIELTAVKNMRAYLYTITRNEAYRRLRQVKEKTISIDDMPVAMEMDNSSIEGEMIESEMMDSLNQAITELPERCKLIFLMVRQEQMKYKEIAEVLSITEGTIEQQMNIAIKKIASTIKQLYPYLDL